MLTAFLPPSLFCLAQTECPVFLLNSQSPFPNIIYNTPHVIVSIFCYIFFGRGTSQDVPFDLIIWYVYITIYFA